MSYHNVAKIKSAGMGYPLILFLILFLFDFESHAAEIDLAPSISGAVIYDDNIAYSKFSKEDGYIITLAPEVELQCKTDRTLFETGIRGNFSRYINHDELDQNHYGFNLGVATNLSEKFRLNGSASRSRESTLDTELSETGVLTQRSDVDRDNLGLGFSYVLGEKTRIALNSAYFRTEYRSDSYTDYDGASVAVTLSRIMDSGKDTLFLQPYYSENSSTFSSVKSLGLYTGWSREISETLSLSTSIGARRTETEYFILRDKDWGWIADISIVKKGETWKADLALTSDMKLTSYGDPVETYKLGSSFSKQISDKTRFALSGAITNSESTGLFSLRDTVYYSADSSLSYFISNKLLLRLSYIYTVSHDSLRNAGKDIDRNRLALALTYRFKEEL